MLLRTSSVLVAVSALVVAPRRRALGVASQKEPMEPLSADLVAGDACMLFAAQCYLQVVTDVTSVHFQGWAAPVTTDSLASLPAVVSESAFLGCLWIVAGLRYRIFNLSSSTGMPQLAHTAVDAACLRVFFALLDVVASGHPADVPLLLLSMTDSVLWVFVWRVALAQIRRF